MGMMFGCRVPECKRLSYDDGKTVPGDAQGDAQGDRMGVASGAV